MKIAIAFGANLGEPRETFKGAKLLINERVGQIIAESPLVQTEPLKTEEEPLLPQDDYSNALLLVDTTLSAVAVLSELLSIETEFGRDREKEPIKWGPRIIDLDLILYESEVIDSESLTVPHSEMHKRDFILSPLSQLWPKWVHPVLDQTAAEMLEGVG